MARRGRMIYAALLLRRIGSGHLNPNLEVFMGDKAFLSDVKTLRARARKHIEKGAVTESYKADLKTVLKILNEPLATAIICVLRYKRHYFMATGINAPQV